MAQIDSDIYFRNKGLDLGKVMDAYQEGVKLKDLADQRGREKEQYAKQKSIEEAYKAGVVKNPDGTFKQDRGVTLSKIAEFDPRVAMEQEAKWKASDYEDLTRKRDEVGKFAGFVANVRNQVYKDPSSYPTVLNQAKSMGYDVSMMPQQYGPDAQKMIETFYSNAIGAQKDIDNQFRQQELNSKAEDRRVQRDEQRILNGFKLEDRKLKEASGENLPLDQKKLVENLSTKNANKISIKNQIDAVLDSVKDKDDSSKLQAYKELLKTLNSTEGSDAVGAEEVKRLATKLEFAVGGLKSGNYGQFGRDLSGFENDARTRSSSIGDAINRNQETVNQAMGRSQSAQNKNAETVKMMAPDGSIREVPANLVGEAIAAGGKKIK